MSYICIHLHINNTHIYIHIHKHTCIHIHINIPTYLYTSIQPLFCVRICLFSHVLVDTCEYMYLPLSGKRIATFFTDVKEKGRDSLSFFWTERLIHNALWYVLYLLLTCVVSIHYTWRTHPITQHAHTGVFRVSDCLNTRTCFRKCLSCTCYTLLLDY